MIYCQTDFINNPPDIEYKSVDLVISSVPKVILEEELGLLFGLLNRYMNPNGWILIDAPSGHGKSMLSTWHASEGSHWIKLKHYFMPAPMMYPDNDQCIYVFYHESHLQRLPKKNFDLTKKREMGHQCEFDSGMIGNFIKHYSKEGDTVLDPFCGTGTVPGEAEILGRKGIGCDVRPFENIREEYR